MTILEHIRYSVGSLRTSFTLGPLKLQSRHALMPFYYFDL